MIELWLEHHLEKFGEVFQYGLFCQMDQVHKQQIAAAIISQPPKIYKKGDSIARKGHLGSHTFIVESGGVSLR